MVITELDATHSGEPTTHDAAPRTVVAVASGDGIGPEIMAATLEVLDAAGARLDVGMGPERLKRAEYSDSAVPRIGPTPRPPAHKTLHGVDVFIHWRPGRAADLADRLRAVAGETMDLRMITNRGVKVWPDGLPETFLTDHWRCRFQPEADGAEVTHRDILALLGRIEAAGLDFIKTEHLCAFDGKPAFSLGQGQ